jgi:hypothetical protein
MDLNNSGDPERTDRRAKTDALAAPAGWKAH